MARRPRNKTQAAANQILLCLLNYCETIKDAKRWLNKEGATHNHEYVLKHYRGFLLNQFKKAKEIKDAFKQI
jgi:hypothetical protein